MTRIPPVKTQARLYREAGLRIMPIAMPAARPAVPEGSYGLAVPDATWEPADFGRRHHVGILCGRVEGREGVELLGLDRDGEIEWSALEDLLGAELPPTLTSKGDRHRYYWIPAGLSLKQRNGVVRSEAGAIDTRPHSGGYMREPWEWDGGDFDADAIARLGKRAVKALCQILGKGPRDRSVDRDTRTQRQEPRQRKERTALGLGERAATMRGEAPASAFDFSSPPDLSSLAKHLAPRGVPDDRHGLVRALGGWLARRGYSAEAVRASVSDLCAGTCDDPSERAAQAADAAERVRDGLEAPGWEYLSRRFSGKTLRRLERACRDPREPDGFGCPGEVWSEWWAGVWPRISETFAARVEASRARQRAEAVASLSTAAPLPPGGHAAQDGTGLHLHPATGWPWILQKGDFYWLHAASEVTYRHEVRACELEASVARNLAGLVSEDERQPKELRASWIKPLDRLRATYTARAHTYEPATNTLTLAALRWTKRPAQYHEHLDEWLRVLFGGGYDAAAQWIASLSALTRPAPCLYLPGGAGLGKSLLADGLAAIWSRPAAVDMSEAIDNFNAATGECPLVFTDEGFPEGMRFEKFRKMITEHSRRVNEKQRAKVDVEGCGRFMIAANNEDVLRYQKIGTLTRDDLDAISERLLVIPCQKAARAVVDRLDTQAAASHEIAEHAAWLAETVELEPHGRMAAKPGGGERILASVVAGRSSEILTRLRETIGLGEMGEKSGVRVPKGDRAGAEVWVNVQRLGATFDGRVTLAALKECCDSFSLRAGTEQHKSADGDNLRWRVLSRVRLDEAFAKLD